MVLINYILSRFLLFMSLLP